MADEEAKDRSGGEAESMHYYEMTGFMSGHAQVAANCSGTDFPNLEDASLFLDFDGTLVHIAERPMDVVVPERVTRLLDRALDRLDGRVAIVSGRTIDDLEHFLPDFDGTLIGTHGAELRAAGKRMQAEQFDLATVSRLQRLAADFAALRPEFLVENKPSGVVMHFRQAERQSALAMHFMETLANAADGFRLQPALMAYEIKPENVGKDVALGRLLEKEAHADKTPVFVGDDLTDEPAIELVQSRGGLGIKIGEAESVANHRLNGPDDLLDALEAWLA